MKYYRYLYTSESVKKSDRIKLRLNEHRGLVGYYIIAINKGSNQLDIINSVYLKLPIYRKNPPIVVGLAKSYDEAVDLVIKMTNEAIEKTGFANIKDYLKIRVKTKDFTVEEG